MKFMEIFSDHYLKLIIITVTLIRIVYLSRLHLHVADHPPIITFGAPNIISLPWAVWSPILAAGIPIIITDDDPFTIVSGGPTHTSISPTLAAGREPINTVGAPGPIMGPPM
jgi:hypothetical protein